MLWVYWILGLSISTVLCTYTIKRTQYGYSVLLASLASFMLLANILATRIVRAELFGLVFIIPSVALVFPWSTQLTDMINEVYGRRATYIAILVSYIINVFAWLIILHASTLQSILDPIYEEAWRYYFIPLLKITIASSIAFLTSSFLDAKIFADIKKMLYVKYREYYRDIKWIILFVLIRSVTSDLVNMSVDTIIFATLAFYGILPTTMLLSIIPTFILIKIFSSLISEPFFIIYRILLRDVERVVD